MGSFVVAPVALFTATFSKHAQSPPLALKALACEAGYKVTVGEGLAAWCPWVDVRVNCRECCELGEIVAVVTAGAADAFSLGVFGEQSKSKGASKER